MLIGVFKVFGGINGLAANWSGKLKGCAIVMVIDG
jgi:hypothetical protein